MMYEMKYRTWYILYEIKHDIYPHSPRDDALHGTQKNNRWWRFSHIRMTCTDAPPLVYRTLSSSQLYVLYCVPGSMYKSQQTEVPPPPYSSQWQIVCETITQRTNPSTAPVHSPKQFGGKKESSRCACNAHTQQQEMLLHLNRPVTGPRHSFNSSIYFSPWMSIENYKEVVEVYLLQWKSGKALVGVHRWFHCRLKWKLPWDSIYPDVLLPTPTSIANFELLLQDDRKGPPASARSTFTSFSTNFHGNIYGSQYTAMDARGSRYTCTEKIMEVGRVIYFMELRGSFHYRWKCKFLLLPSISRCTNILLGSLHELPYKPSYFHLPPRGSQTSSSFRSTNPNPNRKS